MHLVADLPQVQHVIRPLGDFKICTKELYDCLETLGYLASNQHVFVAEMEKS